MTPQVLLIFFLRQDKPSWTSDKIIPRACVRVCLCLSACAGVSACAGASACERERGERVRVREAITSSETNW